MPTIRSMTQSDLPLALTLAKQAGWNQVEADWLRFLNMEPEGCFIAEVNGDPVGTTVACVFGSVAWIGMVLVHERVRHRGVATDLMKHALAFLEERGARTVRLNATDQGWRVYERLGFVTEFSLTRYRGIAQPMDRNARVTSATSEVYDALVAFEARVAGASREKMLIPLFSGSPCGTRVLYRQGRLRGFITSRSGAHALQLGPCVASPEAGAILFTDMLHLCAGQPVMIDIPVDNTDALGVVESNGLTAQRSFVRMFRGEAPTGDRSALWASSGPEKG